MNYLSGRLFTAAVSLTLLALAAVNVTAQTATDSEPQPPYAPAQDQAAEVDSETLDSFVGAYQDVQKIQQDYTERLQATDEQEQIDRLQQQAHEEMQQAVIDNGLTVSEYEQIASRAGQDMELRSRIVQKLNETSGEG